MSPVRDPAAHLPPEATRQGCREVTALVLRSLAAFAAGFVAFLIAANHFGG